MYITITFALTYGYSYPYITTRYYALPCVTMRYTYILLEHIRVSVLNHYITTYTVTPLPTPLQHYPLPTETSNGGPRDDMVAHSTNPRIAFTVSRSDASGVTCSDTAASPSGGGGCHAIVSVLQDYRDSEDSSNALLVPFGFCVYKVTDECRP